MIYFGFFKAGSLAERDREKPECGDELSEGLDLRELGGRERRE
jgi:hypothetical protein